MFQWEKQRTTLATQPGRILRLERSIADIQVSLPGLAPETARAYLCAYRDEQGIRVAVVLHLLQSDRLAFYMNQDGPLDSATAERALSEGLHFVETLGFTLGDLDFRRRPVAEQRQFWASLGFFLDRGQRKPYSLHAVDSASSGAAASEPGNTPPASGSAAETGGRPAPKVATVLGRHPSADELRQRREASLSNLGRLLGML